MIFGNGESVHGTDHDFSRHPGFPYWTLAMARRGNTKFTIREGAYTTLPQEINLIEPNTPYTVNFGGHGKHYQSAWIIFSPKSDWKKWMRWRGSLKGFHHADIANREDRKEILDCFARVNRLRSGADPDREDLSMNLLERILILASRHDVENPMVLEDTPLFRVLESIHAKLQEEWSVERMAKIAHLSPSRFAHHFSEQTGVSPMKYLERERIERAKSLLISSNNRVHHIAREVGFPNADHFSNRFKLFQGQSPRDFRRSLLKQK